MIILVRHVEGGGERHQAPSFEQQRDVQYYTHAARILGLLDGNHRVTDVGRATLDLSGAAQHRRLEQLFAQSACGAAWLQWSKAASVDMLDPSTAEKFLAERSELTKHLRFRRAKTLRRWLETFRSADTDRPKSKKRAAANRSPARDGQLVLAQAEPQDPVVVVASWPDVRRFPHNEAGERVHRIVEPDLDTSEILVVTGYASLDRVIPFLARRVDRQGPQRVRLLFGNEPFPARKDRFSGSSVTLEDQMRDYWLERGVSVLQSAALLRMRALVERRAVDVRLGPRRPLHAKIFVGERAVTLGSSNFSDAGFAGQSEANARFEASDTDSARFQEAKLLAEGFWTSGKEFREGFLDLLDRLLRPVSWQEALARACAALLEGEWAEHYLAPDELDALYRRLWPHQRQGLSQALWILENVGSVLIADATGSGKTRMGALLVRSVYDRYFRARSTHVNPLILVPPSVVASWDRDLAEARLPLRVDSYGPLSNKHATQHKELMSRIRTAGLVVVDEAHNFLRRSGRTRRLLLHYADHAALFTATPINREAMDLVALVDLLGADHLPDETLAMFGRLRQLVRGGTRRAPSAEMAAVRREIGRFMVRRTRSELNRIADARPNEYKLASGRSARYPRHHARHYPCDAPEPDLRLADEIRDLASKLTGVGRIPGQIALPKALAVHGMTEAQYLERLVRGARALAMHGVVDCLRSSRAAVTEHIHGTDEAVRQWMPDIEGVAKAKTGDVLRRLEDMKGRLPRWRLTQERPKGAPDWLWDPVAHKAACESDAAVYQQIAERTLKLSAAREEAKVQRLLRLLEEQDLLLAFDSHLLSLIVFERALQARGAPVQLFTGQSGALGKQRAQDQFGLEGTARKLIALCSDAMSEGLNLQGASCVVHLDTPTVIRDAEQRAGRVDRMNSRHDDVYIWWPHDPVNFAPRRRDLLLERHRLVSDLIGANLTLPEELEPDQPIDVAELAGKVSLEQDQLQDLCDAFQPVRELIGPQGLISEEVYGRIQTSRADVVCCVSIVPAETPWAFAAVGGIERRAPRWAFFDSPSAAPISDLAVVAERLRGRLANSPTNLWPIDHDADELIRVFARRIEDSEIQLLPVRRQRALALATRVLKQYLDRALLERDMKRYEIVRLLLRAVDPNGRVPHYEPRSVADAWLRLIQGYRKAALGARRRSRAPWTLGELELPLLESPIPTERLQRAFDSVPMLSPAGERIVAMIVGVPSAGRSDA